MNRMLKVLLSSCIFFIFSDCFASVTFYNSSLDTMIYAYKICDWINNSAPCSDTLVYTRPVLPREVYTDANISLSDSQQLFVYSIKVRGIKDKFDYTKEFPTNSSGLTGCYAYQSSTMLFVASPAQQEVFCSSGASSKPANSKH